MLIKKRRRRITPQNIVGLEKLCKIKEINSEEKLSKEWQLPYIQYRLIVFTSNDSGTVEEFEINYLFDSDLQSIIEVYGEETNEWIGKEILVTCKKEGEYMKLVLVPKQEVKQ